MSGFFNVVESKEVFGFIDSLKPIGESERINVKEGAGRILAEDVVSPEDLPGFDRSTVDGYAVRSRDVYGASSSTPAILKVIGEIKIDEEYDGEIGEGEALKLPTGGKLPKGADSVVMIEDTREAGELIEVFKPVAPGQNVMRKDEDVSAGKVIGKRGRKINLGLISLLLNLGITEVNVYKKVRVGLISTGDEIIEPEEKREFPKVRDSNTHTLEVLLKRLGFEVKRYGIAKDDFEEVRSMMKRSYEENDVTVTSGGSSVGVRDYTTRAIDSIGKPGVVIHGVLISPGKPTIFGKVGDHVFVGLPGHPSSFILSAFYFLIPLLKKISGDEDWMIKPTGKYVITTPVFSRQGRETLIWAKRIWKDGEIIVEPILFKSGMISPMSISDGFIRIPAGVEGFYEGEEVELYSIWENLLI